ncbi:CRISPR-associated protein [Colibacter massiliensis]|uniref:CRISPR-associated protein n=1 Tax=Colibacter massiliensis TaxID=1852379 RepID=UPI00266D79A4|nr:CRISPR-associated protein [Colibacter massiliensis]
MFLNYTNHPLTQWPEAQIEAAKRYGELVERPFPQIDAAADESDIRALAVKELTEILALHPTVVLCQGEFTFVYAMVQGLKRAGVKVLAACSDRQTKEWLQDRAPQKLTTFAFVRFREYTE